jgi:predicted transcriptional regulator
MNINSKLRDLLIDSGLSESEAITYIELLKRPAEKIFDLISRTKLTKSTIYRSIEKLEDLKMIERSDKTIKALSLKSLVADLKMTELKLRKTVHKIQQLAPFLHAPVDAIEEFQHLYTTDQMIDAYLFMSELDYNKNLEYGDFESFAPVVGGLPILTKFRDNRVKHATHKAICTTTGPYTKYFGSKESEQKYKNNVELLNLDFNNKWVLLSDNRDYVLINNMEDPEYPNSLLVKSKILADVQRAQFNNYSQMIGNN